MNSINYIYDHFNCCCQNEGRAIGAVIGACVDKVDRVDEVEAMRYIYKCMAIAAAVIATLYFVLYHGILKPRCHAQTVQGGQRQPPTIIQGDFSQCICLSIVVKFR